VHGAAGPSSSASAAFLSRLEGSLLSRLADEWLAWLREPPLMEIDFRQSAMPNVAPIVGIVLLSANDLARFLANDVVHNIRLRRRMVRSAMVAGLPRSDARRFVGIFNAAYEDATRFSTDVEHQRRAVRSALGL
jgi:hypothetical protein